MEMNKQFRRRVFVYCLFTILVTICLISFPAYAIDDSSVVNISIPGYEEAYMQLTSSDGINFYGWTYPKNQVSTMGSVAVLGHYNVQDDKLDWYRIYDGEKSIIRYAYVYKSQNDYVAIGFSGSGANYIVTLSPSGNIIQETFLVNGSFSYWISIDNNLLAGIEFTMSTDIDSTYPYHNVVFFKPNGARLAEVALDGVEYAYLVSDFSVWGDRLYVSATAYYKYTPEPKPFYRRLFDFFDDRQRVLERDYAYLNHNSAVMLEIVPKDNAFILITEADGSGRFGSSAGKLVWKNNLIEMEVKKHTGIRFPSDNMSIPYELLSEIEYLIYAPVQ